MKLGKIVPLEDCTARRDGKYRVGDRVYAPHFGEGIITEIDDRKTPAYPIEVQWVHVIPPYHSWHDCFTLDGQYDLSGANPDFSIYSLRALSLNMLTKKSEEEDTGVVERMEDALFKKTEDAINPSHYKVKGISEAHEIINHLMHREQLEGFYWGNIIKYAYRYGRKGDKAETAGKIGWYAQKLKELKECESE